MCVQMGLLMEYHNYLVDEMNTDWQKLLCTKKQVHGSYSSVYVSTHLYRSLFYTWSTAEVRESSNKSLEWVWQMRLHGGQNSRNRTVSRRHTWEQSMDTSLYVRWEKSLWFIVSLWTKRKICCSLQIYTRFRWLSIESHSNKNTNLSRTSTSFFDKCLLHELWSSLTEMWTPYGPQASKQTKNPVINFTSVRSAFIHTLHWQRHLVSLWRSLCFQRKAGLFAAVN